MSVERATLTVEETAVMLGISRNTAFRAVQKGEIPSVRIGRRILIPRDVMLLLLAESSDKQGTAQ